MNDRRWLGESGHPAQASIISASAYNYRHNHTEKTAGKQPRAVRRTGPLIDDNLADELEKFKLTLDPRDRTGIIAENGNSASLLKFYHMRAGLPLPSPIQPCQRGRI